MENKTIKISRERVLETYATARELGHMDAMCAMESLFGKDTFRPEDVHTTSSASSAPPSTRDGSLSLQRMKHVTIRGFGCTRKRKSTKCRQTIEQN